MILITDDDKVGRDSMCRILEREGHTTESAQSVDQALDLIQRLPIDLIVCDFRMPGKSGLDLLMELNRQHCTIPVLMVSAFADSETKAMAMKFGAKDFLQKPFRRKELVDRALKFAIPRPGSGNGAEIENILVPFDYSVPAFRALRYGLSLAREYRAQLKVVHVIPSLAAFDRDNHDLKPDIEELAMKDAEQTLAAAVSPICRAFGSLHQSVKVGDIREEIMRTIHDERISLVVMGTHGRGSIGRLLIGSTTEGLLRKIPVPVVTVTGKEWKEGESISGDTSPIRSIVYATDLSASAEHGLRYAAELARTLKAELNILHVVDILEAGQWAGEMPGANPFDFSDIQIQAEARLREALKNAASEDIKARIDVIEGRPHETILLFADVRKADLLVLNLKSRGTLERIMMGSTAESVIRSSHIPVLSVPVETTVSLAHSNFGEKQEVHK